MLTNTFGELKARVTNGTIEHIQGIPVNAGSYQSSITLDENTGILYERRGDSWVQFAQVTQTTLYEKFKYFISTLCGNYDVLGNDDDFTIVLGGNDQCTLIKENGTWVNTCDGTFQTIGLLDEHPKVPKEVVTLTYLGLLDEMLPIPIKTRYAQLIGLLDDGAFANVITPLEPDCSCSGVQLHGVID